MTSNFTPYVTFIINGNVVKIHSGVLGTKRGINMVILHWKPLSESWTKSVRKTENNGDNLNKYIVL